MAGGVLLFGLAQACLAQRSTAAPEAAPRAAIVKLEESKNANILYFHEAGGLVNPAVPAPEGREARISAKATAVPAPAAADKAAMSDARRAAKRRAAASDVMVARP